MPETLHSREYYLEKAEKNTLLNNAIAGEDPRFDCLITFEGSLDGIIGGLEAPNGMSDHFQVPHITEFKDYVAMVRDILGDTGTPLDSPTLCRDAAALRGYEQAMTGAAINGTVAALNAACLLLPVVFPVSAFFVLLNGGFCAWNLKKAKAGKTVKDSKEETFAQLYDAARSIDLDIGKCFLHEHFTWARSRFELTYRSLSGEERADADATLYNMLSAGALDMGEVELDRYLSDLLENEVAPDA